MNESRKNAENRVKRRIQMETSDIKKTKIHFDRIDRTSWDKTGLKAYINECLKNNENVDNWSDLARMFNVTDMNGELSKNGGQNHI